MCCFEAVNLIDRNQKSTTALYLGSFLYCMGNSMVKAGTLKRQNQARENFVI